MIHSIHPGAGEHTASLPACPDCHRPLGTATVFPSDEAHCYKAALPGDLLAAMDCMRAEIVRLKAEARGRGIGDDRRGGGE